MIGGLCGFADLIRQHGGDVGSAELIDGARALTISDLADRRAVHRALRITFTWSTVHPQLFDQLFDEWFSGRDLDVSDILDVETSEEPSVALDADAIDAARIHTDESTAIEVQDDRRGDDEPAATGSHRSTDRTPAPSTPTTDDGTPIAATGELALVPPRDDVADNEAHSGRGVVELPNEPLAVELEMAREALAAALSQRQRVDVVASPRRVHALTQPLSGDERAQLVRLVRQLDRRLDGAPSWQRMRAQRGAIDLRRTMRRAVTTAGLPVDVQFTGRRTNAARLVVLADLSMSVRGTARLVLHLVHRMRSQVGALRAFGFVDTAMPLDGALRIADATTAIEHVLGLVDIDTSSDPGRAFRQWWTRWHHLVAPTTHVMVLSDGRCNGHDPAFGIIDRITRNSATTTWVSPEPPGAWSLGRGEMADYAQRVDRAVTIRTIDDLDRLVPPHRTRILTPARPA
ncbi:MAG: VWA domain-containing protein [Actinomycetota bacterium]